MRKGSDCDYDKRNINFLKNIPMNNPNWPVVSEKCAKNRKDHFDTFGPLFCISDEPKKAQTF
jgi:hypothetical protein